MIRCVIFDIGGVLLDWDPRHLYRKLFDDDAAMEVFLAEVLTDDWIARVDEGASLSEAVAALAATHPEQASTIRAYEQRWPETIGGAVEESVALLPDLKARGLRLYALGNWGRESFAMARACYAFFDLFDGIVTSGEVGVRKPDRRMYRALLERFAIDPQQALFIDDAPANVAGAEAVGLCALQFTTPAALRSELRRLGLL